MKTVLSFKMNVVKLILVYMFVWMANRAFFSAGFNVGENLNRAALYTRNMWPGEVGNAAVQLAQKIFSPLAFFRLRSFLLQTRFFGVD